MATAPENGAPAAAVLPQTETNSERIARCKKEADGQVQEALKGIRKCHDAEADALRELQKVIGLVNYDHAWTCLQNENISNPAECSDPVRFCAGYSDPKYMTACFRLYDELPAGAADKTRIETCHAVARAISDLCGVDSGLYVKEIPLVAYLREYREAYHQLWSSCVDEQTLRYNNAVLRKLACSGNPMT